LTIPAASLRSLASSARRAAERVLGRTYDGASPPPRLVDEVMAFSALHPGASPAEWEEFALGIAAGAWRDGFSYGVEWRERIGEPAPFDEAALTEEERRLRLWTAPGLRVEGDPLADVPPERRAEVLRELEFAAGYGGFRWIDAETGRHIFPPAVPAAEEEASDGDDEGAGEEGGDAAGG
jgi:hypothetical protein